MGRLRRRRWPLLLLFLFTLNNLKSTSCFTTFPSTTRLQALSSAPITDGSTPTSLFAVSPSSTTSSSPSANQSSNTNEKTTSERQRQVRMQLLDEALYDNATSADLLLSEFGALRAADDRETVDDILNDFLRVVDNGRDSTSTAAESESKGTKSSSLPWWTRLRVLTRFSRRARLRSLRRVLDLSTPSAEEKESIGDDIDAAKRRRRRSLVMLLQSLSTAKNDDNSNNNNKPQTTKQQRRRGSIIAIWKPPAILTAEIAARRDARSDITASYDEMERRLPSGLETPRYEVLVRRPSFGYEIRRYEGFAVCSIDMNRPRPSSSETDAKLTNPQLSGASSFGALAGYLFGKNDKSASMKMTTPVLTTTVEDDPDNTSSSLRRMSFVLPSEYWNRIETAPKPLETSGVTLTQEKGGDRAAIMFGGFAAKKDVETRTRQLLEGLAKDRDWVVVEEDAEVVLAQYNDPFTPPWKRRNEVSVSVVPSK